MKKKMFASVDFFRSILVVTLITYPLYCYINSQFILKLENDWVTGLIIWICFFGVGLIYIFFLLKSCFLEMKYLFQKNMLNLLIITFLVFLFFYFSCQLQIQF
jgi:hypothetical protein